MVTLDYKLMLSLSLWQYNHHPDEGLTSGLFQKTFGPVDGKHYYEKWTGYFNRNLWDMIAYFRGEGENGQKFCDMIAAQVELYTKNRTKFKYLRMKKYGLIFIMSLLVCVTMKAQECERYIEVTGTSEMEVVPDEIHYLIEIQEYFEEEFDGVSKPEQYKTKVPITRIEQELMQAIHDAGIPDSAVRVQEYGNNWRHRGHDFLISKQLDITLQDFKQIDRIVRKLNTRGIHSMRIGKLDNKDILTYQQKAKIEALKAAQRKAAYLVKALDKKLGPVMHIVENETDNSIPFTQSNVLSSYAVSFNNFRIIKKNYSMRVRFEIAD